MARAILDIAREAAERENTAPPPPSLFASDNNGVARILRVAAVDTMREYLRKTSWESQSEIMSQWAFTLTPGRYAYPLPPDFLSVVPGSEQRAGWELGLLGPADPITWARWLSGAAATTAPFGWMIRNNAMWLDPTPTVQELVTVTYISRYPVVSEIRPGDYDMTRIPIVTVAPYVPRDGHIDVTRDSVAPTAPDDALYDSAAQGGFDVGTWADEISEILKRVNPQSGRAPLPQVRRPEFTADTDRPAFEDDHILSLGMHYRLRRALGLEYAEAAAEYEAEMDAKANRDAGHARTIRIGRERQVNEAVPIGGGRWLVS